MSYFVDYFCCNSLSENTEKKVVNAAFFEIEKGGKHSLSFLTILQIFRECKSHRIFLVAPILSHVNPPNQEGNFRPADSVEGAVEIRGPLPPWSLCPPRGFEEL